MTFKLRDYQEDAVQAILNDLDKDGNSLVVLPTGCHEIDYPIVMADGSIKKVQDVVVGDFVMGLNSIPRRVIELHRGNENAYRITTTKGESFCVNENHILHLRNTTTPDKYYPAYVNIAVKDYLHWAKARKHLYKLQKRGYEPFFSESYLNAQGAIPYMVGVWLGDGTASCSQITNPDVEIIDYIKDFCRENNLRYRKLASPYGHSITTGRWSVNPNIFRETLKKYNLYGNKHIPEIYFQSTREIRLQLLAGILDADGHYDQARNIYDLGLSDERLFDDCLRLIRSLGFYCTKRLRTDCNGKTVFRTSVCGDEQETIPCLVRRKQAKPRQQIKDVNRFGFTVEPIGKMDYYGFAIDGTDKLYIDGQGFIQHNSGKSIVIAEAVRRINKPSVIIQPSKEILEQNAEKLSRYVPKHEIGIFSASFNKKQIRKFTFGTIQSMYKKAELFKGAGLVLIDECFVAGTKVSGKNIEEIKVGDLVESFNHKTNTIERKEVEAVSKRCISSKLTCIDLVNRSIITTENHPIYVIGKGYIQAKEVKQGDDVYVYQNTTTQKNAPYPINLFRVWKRNTSNHKLSKVEIQKDRRSISLASLRAQSSESKNRSSQCTKLRKRISGRNAEKDFRYNEATWTQTESAERQWNRFDGNSKNVTSAFTEFSSGIYSENSQESDRRIPTSLQNRLGAFDTQNSYRNRRQFALDAQKEGCGQKENASVRVARVESVKVLQQTSDGRFSNGCQYDYVYNLQVKDNNNYFANGVLVHNCDLMNPKNQSSMFTSFLNAIGLPKVLGLTATPYRNMQLYHKNKYGGFDSQLTLKLINRIKPDFWKRIIFNVNNQELFADGYLCPLKYFDRAAFDHTEIAMNKSRTDFDTEKFAKKMEKMRPTILDLVIRASRKMKSVLVFCSSISEAYSLAQVTPNSAFVDGKTPKKERDEIISGFRSGQIKVVYNVGVLTVGFDHPELDCIFILRPTRSLRLHYQMIGRGIRIAEGKEHCVVVDFTSNVKNLGRIETIELVEEKRMFDYRPMWYLKSESSADWHGRVLYSFSKEGERKSE